MPTRSARAAGQHYLWSRARRADLFAYDDLEDAQWDMLVDLYLNRDQDPRSTTSVCEASRLPLTTALRWIGKLYQAGLLTRDRDPSDARRWNLRLTAAGEARVMAWLQILSAGAMRRR